MSSPADRTGRNGTTEPTGAAFSAVTQPPNRAPLLVTLVVLALVAVGLLTRMADTPPDTSDAQSLRPGSLEGNPIAATAQAVPGTVEPSGTPPAPPASPAPPALNPRAAARVTPQPTGSPAASGPTTLTPAGRSDVRLTIALGDDWQHAGDFLVVKAPLDPGPPLSIGAWIPERVHTYPCRWSAAAYATSPPSMSPVTALARALSSWWGQDPAMPPNSNSPIAPLATTPTTTTIAGHPALYLEVLIPTALDLAQCDAGQLILWDGGDGTSRAALPGELLRLWIVDLEGDAVVIAAAASLFARTAERRELQLMLDSLAIED